MHPGAEHPSWHPILLLAVAGIAACLVSWTWALTRWRQGRSIVPFQPRRPAPWNVADLLIVVAVYLLLQSGVFSLAELMLGPADLHIPTGRHSAEHAVSRLMAEGNPWTLLLCVVSAAVVAPLAEELFFRVLLQGWMESLENHWRSRLPTLHRLLPVGSVPVLLTALVFARLHFRVESPQINPDWLVFLLAGDVVARLLCMGFAAAWLRWRVGATAADWGIVSGKVQSDMAIGLAAFAAVAAPIYALQLGFRCLLPDAIAPDPFPLFFFALVLGILYYRTRRLLPIVVIHAAFNATSLALAWLTA